MNFLKKLISKRATKYTGGSPQTPQYWVKKLFGHENKVLSGVDINSDSVLKYSPVWAAVNIISGAIGFLPLVTYKRLDKGKERAYLHPLYELLHTRPNPYMDSLTFREVLQAHALIWGNGYAEIEFNGAGRPIALWPLLPMNVVPKLNNQKIPVYEVHVEGEIITLPYESVLHIKGLGFDGLKGYSVVEYMAGNIGLAIAAEDNASAFFGNDSSPSGLLTTDGVLDPETKKVIEKNWDEKHKGLENKYRVAILHSGLKWQAIGIPAKDAQLIESRKFSISDVARWFNIAPHLIADLEKATFSNIEHLGIEFVQLTLLRWMRRWELECAYKLLSKSERKEYFCEFMVSGLLRGDTQARYLAYGIGRDKGFLSINDIREMENMNPVENGDIYLEPLNMKPIGTQPVEPDEEDNFRKLFSETWRRITTKEVKAIRKALKSPDLFPDWLDEFYEKHNLHIIAVMSPVVRAFKGSESRIISMANKYTERNLDIIKTAFVSGTVETILKEMESSEQCELRTKETMLLSA
jgi:HK97 family phage portal protein